MPSTYIQHYIQYPFLLASFLGKWQIGFQMPQFIYCHLLSETLLQRGERVRETAGKCVTLHKYITATSSLNNAWVASMIIQHGDQLCLTFITVYTEDALATSQLKLSTPDQLWHCGHLPVTSASESRTCCFSSFCSSLSSHSKLYRWSMFLCFSEDHGWKQISQWKTAALSGYTGSGTLLAETGTILL